MLIKCWEEDAYLSKIKKEFAVAIFGTTEKFRIQLKPIYYSILDQKIDFNLSIKITNDNLSFLKDIQKVCTL